MGYAIGYKTPNLEKSSLAPFPSFMKDNQLNITYTKEFDDYFSDQFPFRSFMISAYSGLNEFLFKESGNAKVIVGQKGFLFFAETLDDFFKVNTLSDTDLKRLNTVLGIQKKYLDGLGIQSFFMIAPNKASIYGEFMPATFKAIGNRSNLENLSAMELAIPLIDLKTPLRAFKTETDKNLYHLKDSHWNNIGAAVGYEVMMEKLGKQSLSLQKQTPTLTVDWQGDLTTMLYPSHIVFDKQYHYVLPNAFTFTRAIRSFDDVEIESINPTKTGRLTMFRDSFANALVPYLSDSFGQVNYSRVFPYDYRKIKTQKPDTLVIEIAERNVNWLLQSTPILVSEPVAKSTSKSSEIDLSMTFDQRKASGYSFLNARYVDQTIGEKVTGVKIIDKTGEYDAFPIYQDGDFEDDKIEYGFSIYTQEAFDMNTVEILVQIDGSWLHVNR
jgi:hypothetical protein